LWGDVKDNKRSEKRIPKAEGRGGQKNELGSSGSGIAAAQRRQGNGPGPGERGGKEAGGKGILRLYERKADSFCELAVG